MNTDKRLVIGRWSLVIGLLCVSAVIITGCGAVGKPELQSPKPEIPLTSNHQHLITRLGSDDWQTREKAQKQLVKLGTPAVSLVEKAKYDDDPEIRFRAKLILQIWAILKPHECELIPKQIWNRVYDKLTLKLERSELIQYIVPLCEESPNAIPLFREFLKDTYNPILVNHLVKANDKQSIPYLKQHLDRIKQTETPRNKPGMTKYKIAVFLVQLGNKSGAEELTKNLNHLDGFSKWRKQFKTVSTGATGGIVSPTSPDILFWDMQKILWAEHTTKEAKILAEKVLNKAIYEFNQVLTEWKTKECLDSRYVLGHIVFLATTKVSAKGTIHKTRRSLPFDQKYLNRFILPLVNMVKEIKHNPSLLLEKVNHDQREAKNLLGRIIICLESITRETFFKGPHWCLLHPRLALPSEQEKKRRKEREEWKKVNLSTLIKESSEKIEPWWSKNKKRLEEKDK